MNTEYIVQSRLKMFLHTYRMFVVSRYYCDDPQFKLDLFSRGQRRRTLLHLLWVFLKKVERTYTFNISLVEDVVRHHLAAPSIVGSLWSYTEKYKSDK